MGLSGFELGALVEYLLAAAAHLDAAAGRALHELHAFYDAACLRGGIGPGDEEVVGETVNGDAEVGLHAIVPGLADGHTAGTDQGLIADLIGDREPGAVDDGVDGVFHAIAGADARGGQRVDRRRRPGDRRMLSPGAAT
ncbi:Uncharacterised protein [Mycobacterium tuberculosis]|nr:Uncharacterised protein [Mycobacterium tuberculosis]